MRRDVIAFKCATITGVVPCFPGVTSVICVQALTNLYLMDFIADQASALIRQVDEENRLTVAIIVILWVSAIASSFIDNIPFTTAMVSNTTRFLSVQL